MRTRGNDVNEFLREVKELEERTSREDRERLAKLAQAKAKPKETEEDRFSRLRAREAELQKERAEERKVLAIANRTKHANDPPRMPERPRQSVVDAQISEATPEPQVEVKPEAKPEPAPRPAKVELVAEPRGFVSSALRHAAPIEPKQKSHHHHSGHHHSPGKSGASHGHGHSMQTQKPKPSWISSAIQHTPALESPKPPTSRPAPSKEHAKEHSPKPKPRELPKTPEPEREPQPVFKALKPQHAGPDPKFRTPSQNLKELRSTLKPKPALTPKELKETAQTRVQLKAQSTTPQDTKPKFERRTLSPALQATHAAQAADLNKAPSSRHSTPEPSSPFRQSLKPPPQMAKEAPPSPEAHEKLKALKPAKKLEPKAEPKPEALERAKTLNRAERNAKPKPQPTEAAKQMEALRPPKPQEREAPPSPEAIERLNSLRKQKPVVKQRIPSTFTKPQLKPTPVQASGSPVSSDFKAQLESALSTPIKRTPTDAKDVPLEHLTKSRARGPRRRLPSAKKSADARSELAVPKRSGAHGHGGSLSKQELKRIASAKYAVKTAVN